MSNPLVIDNTWCEAFRTCWAKGNYRHNMHLSGATTPAALNFGGAIHAGLAAFYEGRPTTECCAVAIKAWRPTPDNPDEWRTPDKLLEVLDQYFELPHNKFKLIPDAEGKPLIEVSAAYPFQVSEAIQAKLILAGYSPEVTYVGILDLPIDNCGSLAIVDHKTTSSIYTPKDSASYVRMDYWDNYKPSKQLPGYLWLMTNYLGMPVYTGVINVLGLSKSNSRHCFEKREFMWTPSEIEEWRVDTEYLIGQWLDCKISGYWPTNGAPYYCHSYSSTCLYNPLCSVPKEVRESKMGLYTIDEWNPLEARKKEAARLEI